MRVVNLQSGATRPAGQVRPRERRVAARFYCTQEDICRETEPRRHIGGLTWAFETSRNKQCGERLAFADAWILYELSVSCCETVKQLMITFLTCDLRRKRG
jgi:hypothetical protein